MRHEGHEWMPGKHSQGWRQHWSHSCGLSLRRWKFPLINRCSRTCNHQKLTERSKLWMQGRVKIIYWHPNKFSNASCFWAIAGVGPAYWRSEGECCQGGMVGRSWSKVVEFLGKKIMGWHDDTGYMFGFSFWTCIFGKLHPDISWVGQHKLKLNAGWHSFGGSFCEFLRATFWALQSSGRETSQNGMQILATPSELRQTCQTDRSNWMNCFNINKKHEITW